MKRFNVAWAATARADLDDIVLYIADDNEANALRVAERIEVRAGTLKTLPGRGRVVPELHRLGLDAYREVIERPWRILYRMDGDQVLVVSILDGRRDLEHVLASRFLR